MCKHILNVQVQIFAQCCRKWFDCQECHKERAGHDVFKSNDLILACKKCKKVFRKDPKDFEDSDEYCPRCDNHYVLEAVEPQAALKIESEDTRMDARLLKDTRIKGEPLRTIFNVPDAPDRLG